MPSTSIGVYKAGVGVLENEEVSSTFEGRHLTFYESNITGHEHSYPTKGHAVVVGEHIVGVVLAITRADGSIGAAANATGDKIVIDTEGIFTLLVNPKDDEGQVAVVAGDELFINKSDGEISKMRNPVTHTRLGYALGGVPSGATAYIIAVKIHWQSQDEEEFIGERATPSVSDTPTLHVFRKYCYEAQGGTEQVGDWLELNIAAASCFWAAAMFRRISWTADQNWITGYSAVAEFELAIGAGSGSMDTCTILQLNSMIGTLSGTGHNNFLLSWLRMQDYAGAVGEQINLFVEIKDNLGTYPGTETTTDLFTTLNAEVDATHALRFMVNDVHYWFLCRSAIT